MDTVGSTEFSQNILMLTRMIETLVERGHLDALVPRQEADRSFPPLARSDLDGDSSVTGAQVRALLRSRRLRDEVFGKGLFADPAWDMLLDLIAARLERTQVSVSSLCIAACVPPTTALRWIRHLAERGLVQREADPEDGRRIFVALSNQGTAAMMRWLRESSAIFARDAGDTGTRVDGPRALTEVGRTAILTG